MIRKNACKKLIAGVLTLTVIAGMMYSPGSAQAVTTKSNDEIGYMVKVTSDSALEDIKSEYKEDKTVSYLSNNNLEEKKIATVTIDSNEADTIKKENSTVKIEPDVMVTGSGTSEKQVEDEIVEWNIQAVHADNANEKKLGEKVKVALIDSGVDLFNDIEIKESINLIPGEEEVLPLFWDTSGHGTSIAGIMAAQDNDEGITGIAPDMELYSARVLDSEKKAPLSRVIEAIYWAIDKKVNIINLSFGTTVYSELFERAIQDAVNAGILVIASAGNNGTVEYPAAFEGVMAVGGTDTSGNVSSFSAIGDEIEVVAPAEKICSTGSFDGTIICSGTSMAAPHVTGIAARLWSKDLSVSANFIRQLIDASANSNCGTENECGYGLVDLERAEKVYDIFKKEYKASDTVKENAEGIKENNRNIEEYNVDYVEGSWTLSDHRECVADGIVTDGATVATIKAGAIYPDNENSNVKGMLDHPCMHGYFKTTNGVSTNNYIQNYITATRFAQKVRNGETISKISSVSANSASDELQNLYSKINWTTVGCTSNSMKGAFAWGVSIHMATDTFAHSVYGNNTTVFEPKGWMRFYHDGVNNGNNFADRSNIAPDRFSTAKDVAKNILKKYVSNTIGDVRDYTTSSSYNENSFKLYNLSEYIHAFGSLYDSLGNSMSKYSC